MPSGVMVAWVLANDVTLMGYKIPEDVCNDILLYLYFNTLSLLRIQTNIVYLNSVAAKNKDIFHNPGVFDPERWARDKPNPYAVLIFGIQEKDLLNLN